MAQKSREIPISKVKNLIEKLSEMGVWGSLSLSFEDGEVKKIIEDFIWTGNEDSSEVDFSGAAGAIKSIIRPTTTKKKLVIRTGAGNGNLS
jgi:hypothetical protein